MKHLRLVALALIFSLAARAFAADIMFEGYYRIALDGKPIGYNIQRYEFDPKAKTFDSVSFLRAKFGGKTVQESLRARANDKFQPISYQYTSQVDEERKTIDATFKGDQMKLVIGDGGKTNKVKNETYKIPKGTFLSSFVVYIMLQKKLTLNEVFKYSAVAEEEGASYYGKAWLESKTRKGPFEAFNVLNQFKGEKFVSTLAVVPDPKEPGRFIKGEIFGSSSPAKNITTQLMETPAQATEGQIVPNKVLVTLFGQMPTGKVHLLATKPAAVTADVKEPAPAKDE